MEAMIVGAQCLKDLDGQVHVNAIHCPYCGTTSPDMEAATAHDGQCEKHPMAVRCAELRAENARLREALEQVQWGDTEVDPYGAVRHLCPLCDHDAARGHARDCIVGAAIDAARREAQ